MLDIRENPRINISIGVILIPPFVLLNLIIPDIVALVKSTTITDMRRLCLARAILITYEIFRRRTSCQASHSMTENPGGRLGSSFSPIRSKIPHSGAYKERHP